MTAALVTEASPVLTTRRAYRAAQPARRPGRGIARRGAVGLTVLTVTAGLSGAAQQFAPTAPAAADALGVAGSLGAQRWDLEARVSPAASRATSRQAMTVFATEVAPAGAELFAMGRTGQFSLQTSVTAVTDASDLVRAHAFHAPISTGHQTSGFGHRWGRDHDGIDIGADYGTPLYAVAHATVSWTGWTPGLGYQVRLLLSDDTVVIYGHLSRILTTQDAEVAPGDLVARVGSSGRSTGAHLHFEVRQDGAAVDPEPWLAARLAD